MIFTTFTSLRTNLRVRNSVAQISACADAHKTTHKNILTFIMNFNDTLTKYLKKKLYLCIIKQTEILTLKVKKMETKEEMYKRIKRNCLLVTDSDFIIKGEAHCCSIENNTPINVIVNREEQKYIFLIGIAIWIVPCYLNNIFSISEIAKALMHK